MPLLAGLFALYAMGKLLHLSPLIMVLFFGLLQMCIRDRFEVLQLLVAKAEFGRYLVHQPGR